MEFNKDTASIDVIKAVNLIKYSKNDKYFYFGKFNSCEYYYVKNTFTNSYIKKVYIDFDMINTLPFF